MVLKSLWQRILPPRRPRESVELDPVAQLALRFLLNYGQQTKERISTEVSATRVASSADVEQALDRLLVSGLVESRESGALYTFTRKAEKLKGHLPQEPQTVTEFYL